MIVILADQLNNGGNTSPAGFGVLLGAAFFFLLLGRRS